MNIIILGAPGSGKGTQATRLAERLNLRHVSTGDLLRDAVAKQTPLGKQVESTMAEGKLVSDNIVLDLVKGAVTVHDPDDPWDGWILDGYPRNSAQAEELEDVLSSARETVEGVVFLDVPGDVIVERLSNRRTCTECKSVFNLLNRAPQVEGKCDDCGGDLVQRDDDKPETVRERLAVYEKETLPILDFYELRYDVHRVNGTRGIDEVTDEILELVSA